MTTMMTANANGMSNILGHDTTDQIPAVSNSP